MPAQFLGNWRSGAILAGWRGLGRFWGVVLLVAGTSAGVLQALGPPAPERLATGPAMPVIHGDPLPAKGIAPAAEPIGVAAPRARPGRDTPGPVAAPDPKLLMTFVGAPNLKLPRVAPDGRAPMTAYAAGFDPSNLHPRVALLVAGIGMSEAASMDAIKNLPGGVTLAISPFAGDVAPLLLAARANGHEYLLSIPMEPQGFPANDPDDHIALMTPLPPAENLKRLQAVLGRIAGYVGVTDALGQMHGERLADTPDQFDAVLEEVAHRGLLFVDARTGPHVLTHAWNRSADIVIDDDPIDAASLDRQLDALTQAALDKGSALGIVSVPRPVTLERVAAWTNQLAAKGVALAPVSALALPPANAGDETKQEVKSK